MIDVDVELRLLRGDSIFVDDIEIKPFTLNEIVDVGYTNYQSMLNMFLLDVNEIFKDYMDISDDISIFDVFLTGLLNDISDIFLTVVKFFLRASNIEANLNEEKLYVDSKAIDTKMWDKIVDVIKLQNCLTNLVDDDINPADSKAKELLRQREEVRKKLLKAKKADSDQEPLSLADLVSILASHGNNLNILNVWDLSFYQFNNQFNRMKMFDDYNVSIRSILAGANPDEIEFKHWMAKIN